MKIEELRANVEAKTVEVRGFLAENKSEDAKVAMEELRGMKEALAITEELELEEKRDLETQKNNEERGSAKMGKVNEMRSVVKHVLGAEMTTEERASIKSTDNSAIIPKQFVKELQEIQKGFGSLKQLCDIIPVFRNEGTIPVIDLDQGELKDVLEGANIVDGTLVTTEIPFKCVKVGLIQSLTSELVEDAEIEIESLVKKNFANLATVKENLKIVKVIKDNAVPVVGTTYEDVQKEIDKAVPAVKAGLVTLVNVSTYAELKNKKDKQGRPLNLITEVNGVEHFHGKPIYAVEDTLLPSTEDMKETYYIVNMQEAVKYCDRKAVTIAKSTEAGFRDDTVKLRILERFDVVKGSVRSIKKIEF